MSLRYRIALTIFILEAMVMSLVLWQTLSHADESIREQMAASQAVTLNLLGTLARLALFIEEYDELVAYIADVEKDPSVVRVLVANQNNRVVVSSDISLLGGTMPTGAGHPDRYLVSKPLANAAGLLGTLAIEFSNERLVNARRDAFALGWSIALIGMLLIAVVGVLMGYLLTRRLQVLQASAERFASGDFEQPVQVRGRDEIARVGAAFNFMAGAIASQIADLEDSETKLRSNNDELKRTSAELHDIRKNLEDLVRERTLELQNSNRELDSFCHSVSHDLRAPLRSISGFTQILLADHAEHLDEEGRDHLHRVIRASQRMAELIDDLLELSRVSRSDINRSDIDVSAMAQELLNELQATAPERKLEYRIAPGLHVWADPRLFRIAMENLLGNAWKYTRGRVPARIEIDTFTREGKAVVVIRDNGAGFDMKYAENLFQPFKRLHQDIEFEGTGIGLATVQRVVHRHYGRVWAEAAVDTGATFYIELPARSCSLDALRASR
ncbi:MAG: ATP-binding protein [Thiogranum sp.]|nr:ATP-binding protein [Thiogranum sp.]